MPGTARVNRIASGLIAAAVLTTTLAACATPTDRELLYAEEPRGCQNGDTPSCIEKLGRPTTCYCTSSEGLRELFELGAQY